MGTAGNPNATLPAKVAGDENVTVVSLKFEMGIDGQKVTMETEIGGDFKLQLTKPAKLGSPITFGYWLNSDYKVSCPLLAPIKDANGETVFKDRKAYTDAVAANPNDAYAKVRAHIEKQGVPEGLSSTLATIFMSELVITDLFIQTETTGTGEDKKEVKRRMFGLSLRFPRELALLDAITLSSVSLVIKNGPKGDTKFPKALDKAPTLASGRITFTKLPASGSSITLGGTSWSFVKDTATGNQTVIGADLDTTLRDLVKGLGDSKDANISRCTYSVRTLSDPKLKEQREIWISANEPGEGGNSFTLLSSAPSDLVVSGKTLANGG